MIFYILAGRIDAVNREFVYIDFDDERFSPCKEGLGHLGSTNATLPLTRC